MTATRPDQLAVSTELVEVKIGYKVAGQPADPTAFTGYIGFGVSPFDEPPANFGNARWHLADWETAGGNYALTLAVGPLHGALALDTGAVGVEKVWHVFAAVDDGSTIAVIKYAGTRTFR